MPRNSRIGGEQKTVFDLKKGMKFTATIVTRVGRGGPTSTRSTTGTAPPPPKLVVERAGRLKAHVNRGSSSEAGPGREVNTTAAGHRLRSQRRRPYSGARAGETAKDQQAASDDESVGLALSLTGFGIRLARKS